jgi:hypothetical protein
MGTKISAKYAGDCKNCGSDWEVGDEICYQKTPKAICVDMECFTEQGGTIDSNRSFGNKKLTTSNNSWTKNQPIITKLPDCIPADNIKQAADIWDQFFVVSHHRVHALYPDEDITGDRFGQIRSKMMDQLMKIAEINK